MKRTPLKRKTPLRAKVRVVRAGTNGPDLTRKPRPVKQRQFTAGRLPTNAEWHKPWLKDGLPKGVTTADKLPQPRKPMKKAGKKTKAWDAARAKLKTAFERAGITVCELKFPGCWRDNALGFAHSKRRRHIVGAEIYEVILCCNPCHDALDCRPDGETLAAVKATIAKRRVAVCP